MLVSPQRGWWSVQPEGPGARLGREHDHLQEHRGGGPQAHTHALQDHDDGPPALGTPGGQDQRPGRRVRDHFPGDIPTFTLHLALNTKHLALST